jgi:hypothetical protein
MPTPQNDQLSRASDPNTDISQLVALLVDFPGNVLRNPAFQIAVVADPTIFAGSTCHIRRSSRSMPSIGRSGSRLQR